MNKLTIAKFGGSVIGIDGEGIPLIIKRIKEIQKNGKLVVVCSAPLTIVDGKKKSLTDIVLSIGRNVANGNNFDFEYLDFELTYHNWFYYGGQLLDVDISEEKMQLFLEDQKIILKNLATEHIKKIEQFKIMKIEKQNEYS
ncbi:MAG: hypothetical protein O3C04_04500 [Crenarchaeota archaeon]|nr:hypothetical protein [Thermoproteota archaeon]